MNKIKFMLGVILLFIAIGIAVVTTNVIVNMSTTINQNPDDFLVYFSDVKVNDVQDLSLVQNEQKLVFNGEFTAVGDKKVITYDITNASSNYDADILISCTNSTTYLNITNVFDMKNPLSARSTRTGTLTIELSTAVSEDVTQDVTCTISVNAVERESKGNNNVSDVPDYIGRVVTIDGEKFNVINYGVENVSILAQYSLGTDYKQNIETNGVVFVETLESIGWDYSVGPIEIDVQVHSVDYVATYINQYVSYLKEETNDDTITGDLITLSKLGELGCDINDDYVNKNSSTCANSRYSSWVVNNQWWWTKSAANANSHVWRVGSAGVLSTYRPITENGVRPVITISKDTYNKYVS